MQHAHTCHLCGWGRLASSRTIVELFCPTCGGLLSSGHLAAQPPDAVRLAAPRGLTQLRALLRVAFICVVFYVGASAGHDAGGAWIAVVAVGLTGLTLAPLIVPATASH